MSVSETLRLIVTADTSAVEAAFARISEQAETLAAKIAATGLDVNLIEHEGKTSASELISIGYECDIASEYDDGEYVYVTPGAKRVMITLRHADGTIETITADNPRSTLD